MSETLPDYQRFRAPSRRVTVALFGHWHTMVPINFHALTAGRRVL